MKLVTSVFVVSVLAVLGVACVDGGGEGLQIGGGAKGAGGAPSATAESNATAAAAASAKCPAGVPEAKQLVTNPNAADLTIAGGHVFYRSLTKVVRANKDGSAQIDVVESADLIRSHVDGTTLLLVESPTPPTAVLRVYELDAKGAIAGGVAGLQKEGATINTKSNAGGTMVIGSDTESLYIHADEEKAEVIYALGRTKDRTLTEVVRVTEGVMSHPQVANDALWYVIEGKRVFKVDLGAAKGIASKPKEIFGMGYASCGLAVGAGKAFCATGAALEQRDIDGSNVKPVLEKDKSKAQAAVDSAMFGGGVLIVRTEFAQKDDGFGRVLRAMKPGGAGGTGVEETIVACGREAISDVAVDGSSIVWLEPGKGVFAAPR